MKKIVILLIGLFVGCSLLNKKDERIVILFKEHKKAQLLDLVSQGKIDLNYQTSTEHFSLMHLAVIYSDSSLLETFIEQGVSLDAVSVEGDTPLILAIQRDNGSLTKILIEDQADPNISNHQGNTALILAAKKQEESVIETLVTNTDDRLDPFLKDHKGNRAIDYLSIGSPAYSLLKNYEKHWREREKPSIPRT